MVQQVSAVVRTQAEMIEELGRLGQGIQRQDLIQRGGTALCIPNSMTLEQAAQAIHDMAVYEEETASFIRRFNYRPYDGAHAVLKVMERVFGGFRGVETPGLFSDTPPLMLSIDIAHDKTMQVPWGTIEVPALPGTRMMLNKTDTEFGKVFMLTVSSLRKWSAKIEGLFILVEEELRNNSIYRGHAINSEEDPGFIDLDVVSKQAVVYNDRVASQLEANIWSGIRHTKAMEEAGLPTRRSVMLTGKYGNGKTLAIMLTAKVAVDNGWTFILTRPGDDLKEAMHTAQLYEPAVLAVEDIDQIAGVDSDTDTSELLDVMDGMSAKGRRIICICTTNHPERIHQGMLRPGRLDAVIEFGPLDEAGLRTLVDVNLATEVRGTIDYAKVYEAMTGFEPAFMKEAIDRSKRYGLVRGNGKLGRIETSDLVSAAGDMKVQLDMMEKAGEEATPRDTMSDLLREEVLVPALAGMKHIWHTGDVPQEYK